MADKGTNQDTTADIAEELEIKRKGRDRRAMAEEAPLDPNNLSGSWFIRIQDDETVAWGLVLGEVQPGFFLVEVNEGSIFAPREETVRYQTPFTIEKMTKEGWRFFDTPEDLHIGFANCVIGDRET